MPRADRARIELALAGKLSFFILIRPFHCVTLHDRERGGRRPPKRPSLALCFPENMPEKIKGTHDYFARPPLAIPGKKDGCQELRLKAIPLDKRARACRCRA